MRETMCAMIYRLWMPVGLADCAIVVVDKEYGAISCENLLSGS